MILRASIVCFLCRNIVGLCTNKIWRFSIYSFFINTNRSEHRNILPDWSDSPKLSICTQIVYFHLRQPHSTNTFLSICILVRIHITWVYTCVFVDSKSVRYPDSSSTDCRLDSPWSTLLFKSFLLLTWFKTF